MKLRIVSGSLKGRYLTIPDRDSDFRPTRERVRESVANILTPRIYNATIADVCAGSGAFGFEMLSRGACTCEFIESDRYRVQLLRQHAERFGVAEKCIVTQSDVHNFTRTCSRRYDIIYFDPPYDNPDFKPLVSNLMAFLAEKGVLVYEQRHRRRGRNTRQSETEQPSPFDLRTYGETEVRLFNRS